MEIEYELNKNEYLATNRKMIYSPKIFIIYIIPFLISCLYIVLSITGEKSYITQIIIFILFPVFIHLIIELSIRKSVNNPLAKNYIGIHKLYINDNKIKHEIADFSIESRIDQLQEVKIIGKFIHILFNKQHGTFIPIDKIENVNLFKELLGFKD